MNQSQDSSDKSGAQQDQKARDDMRNEGGRSGGSRIPGSDAQCDESSQQRGQGSRQDIEREKAERGRPWPSRGS